ncbi:MAG: 3-hydroxyacyl-ACP dehydratase FabZ family protein [Planctomycetota bacterium]|jgi:3-hydroxyacyl-[acyl-carrier-protein] dehydratase
MAATPFIDLNTLELDKLIVTKEQIYQRLPHRYEFMQLDGLIYFDLDKGIAVGLRDIKQDEFWVKGHIPSRPLFPGVLMIESAAQLASYMSYELMDTKQFIGFGGVDAVKFRGSVVPPAKMYIIMKMVEVRSRRIVGDGQGIVDGKLVFEGRITGMPI